MPKQVLTDSDFVDLFQKLGPQRMAEKTGMAKRGIMNRRRRIERRTSKSILPPDPSPVETWAKVGKTEIPGRLQINIKDGIVLVGSDAHYMPDVVTTAHRAFVAFAKEFKPRVLAENGDVLDGSTISRHTPIGWEKRPKLIEEIEACQDRLHELRKASPNSEFVWQLGNHCARFETRLATVAPEYARVNGVHLKDHFPGWQPCWSLWINDDVIIKHRLNKGLHATHNNTLKSGKTMVTGHLHSLKVTPWTDYNGTRYGVDTGTLADPFGPQFNDYMEDGPRNWRSGFVVLTFRNGRLMWPEVVSVVDENTVEFRGELIRV